MTAADGKKYAVLFACDQGYAPFAAFVIWQLRRFYPQASYDIILASTDELYLPSSLDWLGVRRLRIPRDFVPPVYAEIGMPIGYFLKMVAVDMLAEEYDRILFLDADLHFQGGDIERLIRIDLGGKVLGAALDVWYLFEREHVSREFKILGVGPVPYFNSGVMLIDTHRWRGEAIRERSADFARAHPETLVLHDQSALNCVLMGDFAEISIGWNWLGSAMFRFAGYRFPIHFHHFGGVRQKPWEDPPGRQDMRFILAYRQFFAAYWPEIVPRVSEPRNNALFSATELAVSTYLHLKHSPVMYPFLARYRDPYRATFHDRARP